eukprot:2314794-Pyramimonas_sp.AAC.1
MTRLRSRPVRLPMRPICENGQLGLSMRRPHGRGRRRTRTRMMNGVASRGPTCVEERLVGTWTRSSWTGARSRHCSFGLTATGRDSGWSYRFQTRRGHV